MKFNSIIKFNIKNVEGPSVINTVNVRPEDKFGACSKQDVLERIQRQFHDYVRYPK